MAHQKHKQVPLEEEDTPVRPAIWRQKGVIASLIFSFFWMIFVIHYLRTGAWWATRADLSPAELVGGLGGLCLPMLVVWLISAYFDRSEQLADEAETLRGYLNELVYPTKEGAIYTKTLTDALRVQIQEFRSVFNEVNQQTQSVRDDLKHWISDLGTVINHVDTQTVTSVREIAGHIQALTEATAVATEQTQQAANLFSEQAVILQRVTAQSVSDTEVLAQTLGGRIDDLTALMNAIDAVNARIGAATTQANETTQNLALSSQKIEAAIDVYATDSAKQNARLFGNLEKVLSVFRAQGELLDQEVGQIANRIHVVESGLADNTRQLAAAAEQTMGQLNQAGAALIRQSDALKQSTMILKQELGEASDQMAFAQKQINAHPAVQAVRQTDLLAEAGSLLNHLQTLSVDMAHIFTPKSEEELWDKYYNGDKTVFMRHIKAELGPGKSKKMKELYQTNTAFREAANRYMTAFEDMTQRVGQGDDSKLLLSVLIGSDAGRLYMVLADSVKGK